MSGNLTKLAAAGAIATIGVIGFAGVASAHDSDFTLTPSCNGATWKVHYASTATNQELNPTAVIQNSNEVLGPVPGTFQYDFLVDLDRHTFSATTTWTWSDGFTKTRGPKTVTQPDCPHPTTTTPAPTTTVPEVTTTAPAPTTTVPAPTTTVGRICNDGKPPSIPVEDGSLVCPEFGGPPTVPPTTQAPIVHQQVTPKVALPVTGGSGNVLKAGLGAFMGLVGLVLVLVTRRRVPS